jgi:hypothetical protein
LNLSLVQLLTGLGFLRASIPATLARAVRGIDDT